MKTEVTIALVSGLVALLSAGIAYRSENHVAQLQHELQSTHEREMAQLSSDLTNQSQKELTFLRTKLEQQHERQIPFLKEQMRLYFEAVEIAAEIALPTEKSDMEALKARFWQLYWGPLAVVEDQTVVNAMVQFGNSLKAESHDGANLQRKAIALAHACRDSLQKYWVVDLGEFDEQAKQVISQ